MSVRWLSARARLAAAAVGVAAVVALRAGAARTDGRPTITIDAPRGLAPEGCFRAGRTVTVAGRWVDPDPATGRPRAPAVLELEVRTSDGAAFRLAALVAAGGTRWQVAGVPLGAADGHAVVVAHGVSAAGQGVRTARSWRVDARPPQVEILVDGHAVGATGREPPLVGRRVRLGARVTDSPQAAPPRPVLELDGRVVPEGARVESEGPHVLRVHVEDCAGRRASAVHAFRVDLSPPRLLDVRPADGALLTAGPARLEGRSDPDLVAATVNRRAARVAGGRFVLEPLPWVEGRNRADVELRDAAGHLTRHRLEYLVHSLGPGIEILERGLPLRSGAVYRRAVHLEVRAFGRGVRVVARLDGRPFTPGGLVHAPGPHRLVARAVDQDGHEREVSVDFTIETEGDAP